MRAQRVGDDDGSLVVAAGRERLAGTHEAWRAAAGLYRRALELNSASAYLWCEFGDALVKSGDGAKAEYCSLQGLQLAPRSPEILLAVGDFYVQAGQYRKALPHFRSILGLIEEYDSRIFNYYGAMSLDLGEILESGIPDKRAAVAYLKSFLDARDLKRSEAVWSWMKSHSFIDRPIAIQYAEFLFRQHLTQQAAQVWKEFAGDCGRDYLKATQVYDGGFECEPAGSPFDWKISQVEGAAVTPDKDTQHDGHTCLRMRFDGTHNVAGDLVTQDVFVPPGQYVFEAWIRSLDITTDQGVFFRIVDPNAPARLDVATEAVRGTSAWTKLTHTFTVAPGVTLLQLTIGRRASLRFDNQISGTVWIDSVSVRPM